MFELTSNSFFCRTIKFDEEKLLRDVNLNSAKFEIQAFRFRCKEEQLRLPRIVRIGAFQNELPIPASSTIKEMRSAMYKMAESIITSAAQLNVNVFCFQEGWSKYLNLIDKRSSRSQFLKTGVATSFNEK